MKRLSFLLLALAVANTAFAGESIKLATTTSTDNSGLLKYLLPVFEKEYKIRVDVIAVGTGKAIKLGENGDVDLVLVHSRNAEDNFVKSGFGVNRHDVMYNDFVIIGPEEDPAKIKGFKKASKAFKKIADGKFIFVSRGDDSGTDQKEKDIWKISGISPKGEWYTEAGQGMGPTMLIANEKRGYLLADRGTFIALESKIDLEILVEGDKNLFNPYGVIAVNPAKYPKINFEGAMKFIDWITSPKAQQLIAEFKINGKQLFIPLAK